MGQALCLGREILSLRSGQPTKCAPWSSRSISTATSRQTGRSRQSAITAASGSTWPTGSTRRAGAFKKLFDSKVYSTTLSRNWVWMPNLSWSADGSIIAATVHGKPLGSEQDEFSPVFNVALAHMSGLFEVDLTSQTDMWSAPQFSPLVNTEPAQGYLAYLKSRTPIDSVSSEYDLVVADRDGSNAHIVFPEKDKPGQPGDAGGQRPPRAVGTVVIPMQPFWGRTHSAMLIP